MLRYSPLRPVRKLPCSDHFVRANFRRGSIGRGPAPVRESGTLVLCLLWRLGICICLFAGSTLGEDADTNHSEKLSNTSPPQNYLAGDGNYRRNALENERLIQSLK